MMKRLLFGLFILLFSNNIFCQDLTQGLRSHFKFDGNLESEDNSANRFFTIIGQDSFVNVDPFDQAFYLDGNTSSRTLSKFDTSGFNEISISFWMKTANNSTDKQVLIQGADMGFAIYLVEDTERLGVFFGGSSNDSYVTTKKVNDDSWYHVVATNDGQRTTVYLNNDKVGERNQLLALRQAGALPRLSIGQITTNGWSYTGLLNDLRIYDRVLQNNEIALLYQPFNICNSFFDEPPGCELRCEIINGATGNGTLDNLTVNSNCSTVQPSQWVKLKADSETIKITNNGFSCPRQYSFWMELFDSNYNSISNCEEFDVSRNGQSLTISNLTIGEDYHLRIGGVSSQPSCNFQLAIEGHRAFTNNQTPDIQFFSGSGLLGGKVLIPPVPDAINYLWETNTSSNITLGNADEDYEKFYTNSGGFGLAEICVTPYFPCGIGQKKCVDLNEEIEICPTASNMPPGCEINCEKSFLNIEKAPLMPPAISFGCAPTGDLRTKYYQIEAARDTLVVWATKDFLNSTRAYIQLFDNQMNPVSDCEIIDGNTRRKIVVLLTATVGEKYTFAIASEDSPSSENNYELEFFGNADQRQEPQIQFDSTANGVLLAYIDSTFNEGILSWSITPPATLLGANGTTNIQYTIPKNSVGEICLSIKYFDCGDTRNICRLTPFDVTSTVATDPCIPSPGGIPAGDIPPGCNLCGPIYVGSTEGYTAGPPGSAGFPCGTIENNQFISVVAGPTGKIEGTILATDCRDGRGAQLIYFDQQFNPVSNCYSSGGTNIPGNVVAENLIPGEIYWIMIDGFAGDVCQILLTITGTANSSSPDPPGPITVTPDLPNYCPGATACFSIDPVGGATSYEWIIPGNATVVSGGEVTDTVVCIKFDDPGGGVVRVTPSNSCFPGLPSIAPVVAVPLIVPPPPPLFLCANEFPFRLDTITYQDTIIGEDIICFPINPLCTDFGNYDYICVTSVRQCSTNVIQPIIPKVQVPAIIEEMLACGDCFVLGDTCVAQSGTYTLSGNYAQANGCDSIVNLTLNIGTNPTLTAFFDINPTVCVNDPIDINYTGNASPNAIYNWNFNGATILSGSGQGPYQIAFADAGGYQITLNVEENGCQSLPISGDVVVNSLLAPLTINCTSTLNEITFTWNQIQGANNYQIVVDGVPMGAINNTEFTVSGLSPNQAVAIEVTAQSNLGCASSSATQTCTAQNCPPRNVTINQITPLCANQNSVRLTANVSGGAATGTFTWSGSGVSPDGTFNPANATIGSNNIQVQYSENGCTYSATAVIMINDLPTANFMVSSPICVDGTSQITYTGSASANANFNWNFGSAQVLSGSGSGPYEVQFASTGVQEIILQVEQNGCLSANEVQVIEVQMPLAQPTITCTPTLNSIQFNWNDVGASDYVLNVISAGISPTSQSRTSATFDGLANSQTVEIEVQAISNNSCASVSASIACAALDCPPVNMSINPINSTCTGDSDTIQLTAMGLNNPSGSFTWSGNGVQSDGRLITTGLPAGTYSAQVNYSENGCDYSATQNFEVLSNPTITATIQAPIWYPGASGSIILDVQNGMAPYDYNWSIPRTSSTITNIVAGDYCVTVTDQNGCEKTDCFAMGAGIYRYPFVRVICQNESALLSIRPNRGADFEWSPAAGLSCTDCASPFASPPASTIYQVKATLPDGRTDSVQVAVVVLPQIACINTFDESPDFSRIENQLQINPNQAIDLQGLEQQVLNLLEQNDVTIFPNPTSGKVQIDSPTSVEWIHVFDISGREILHSTNLVRLRREVVIDLSGEAAGVYFFKVKTEKDLVTKRIVLLN